MAAQLFNQRIGYWCDKQLKTQEHTRINTLLINFILTNEIYFKKEIYKIGNTIIIFE